MGIAGIGNNYENYQNNVLAGRTVNSSGQAFQQKLENSICERNSKDEYVSTPRNTRLSWEIYNEFKQATSLSSQLPLETQNYKIEVADKCYGKDFVITDKKNDKKLYLNENEIVIQKDKQTGLMFLFDTSVNDTMQPNCVVDEELETALKDWMNRAGNSFPKTDLHIYTVNIDKQTGIKYLTRNGQEGKGADILLLTDADRKKFEEIKNEYLKYPNIAENQDVAEIRAAMEISGNSKRCANGVLTVVDGYMSFTSYDGKKENSWSKILDNKAMYDGAYAKLQSNELQGIEDEEFWNKFFDEMGSGDSQGKESGTDSNIVIKADGSRVLVVTMKIGGMESTMSIKISDPTDFVPDGKNEQTELKNGEEISGNMENMEN